MKKIIFFALCTILTLNVNAQKNNRSASDKADERAGQLKTELGLSDDQHKSVRAAVLEKINSANAVRERYKDSSNKKGMGAELKQVNLRFRTTMDAILTENQKAKYKADDDEEEGDDDLSDEKDQKSDRKAEQNKNKSDKEQESIDKKQASIDKKQAKVERQQAKVKRKEAKVKQRQDRLEEKEEGLKEKKEKLEEKEEGLEKKGKKLDKKEKELKK